MIPDDRRGPALLARPVMREAFRKQLRARVMVEAAVVFAPDRGRSPFFLWLRPAFAAALITIVAMAGATSAAASSLPGDPAFGLKRAAEDLRVALTFDEVARVRLLSDLADRRLEELAEVAKQRPSAAPTATAESAGALDRFADAVGELGEADGDDKRAAALAVAEAAREKHIGVLDSLKPKLPVEAQPSLQRVIEKEKQRATEGDRNRRPEGSGGRTGDRKDERTGDRKDEGTGDRKDERTGDGTSERSGDRGVDRGGSGQSDVRTSTPTPRPTPTRR